jgi:hypothetical protein
MLLRMTDITAQSVTFTGQNSDIAYQKGEIFSGNHGCNHVSPGCPSAAVISGPHQEFSGPGHISCGLPQGH